MNLTAKILLWVGVSLFVATVHPQAAHAVTSCPVNTVNPDILSLIHEPIVISAFSLANLPFVELYNQSDVPINMTGWSLAFTYKNGETIPVAINDSRWLVNDQYMTVALTPNIHGANLYETVPSFEGVVAISVRDGKNHQNTVRNVLCSEGASVSHELDRIKWYQRKSGSSGQYGTFDDFTGKTAGTELPRSSGALYNIPQTPKVKIVEVYALASECSPLDASVLCGDYIKLQIDDPEVDLSQYVLRTDNNSSSRTTSNTFSLEKFPPNDEGFVTVYRTDDDGRINLTNSGGYIWLEDIFGLRRYQETITAYQGVEDEKQGWSHALTSAGDWQWTTTPQPLGQNVITLPVIIHEVKPCPVGQYRNPETNRCRTIEEAVNALTVCPEGQYRNPATNRCKTAGSVAGTSLVPCGEGQERNPATNRCRSIASAVAELLPCDEGYERNPATNRCKKAISDAPSTAGQSAVKDMNNAAEQMSWYIVATVAGTGIVGYGIYEWRSEVAGAWRRALGLITKK